MSNPLVHAFFIGRALAEVVGEQLEHSVTDVLSEFGKFDAEQRERLRQFTEQVIERANQAETTTMENQPSTASGTPADQTPEDLQATIDNLRAEIAQVRSALQQYRNSADV